MVRKLTLVLGGTVLALTIALPASAAHAKPVKPHVTKGLSAHALCLQAIAQANKTFAEQQRAALKTLHDQQEAAKKALRDAQKAARTALHDKQAADRASFHQQHPKATEAELKAFHAQQEAARKALRDCFPFAPQQLRFVSRGTRAWSDAGTAAPVAPNRGTVG